MSGRRDYDPLQPGASTSYRDPYRTWIPPTQQEPISDRARHKPAAGQPKVSDQSAGRRAEAKHRSSSRGYRSDGYVASPAPPPASSQYASVPSTRDPRQSSRPSASHVFATQPNQTTASSSQVPSGSHLTKSQQEAYDSRLHSHKRSATTPISQPSYDRIEDYNRSSSRVAQASENTVTPLIPSTLHPPGSGVPLEDRSTSSRKHRGREKEKEAERPRDKTKDRSERHRERDRGDDRQREKDRIREKDRYQEVRRDGERDASSQREHRRSSRPPLSTRAYTDPKFQDPDSSDSASKVPAVNFVHRRHRTEEGTSSTSTARQRHRDPMQPSNLSLPTQQSSGYAQPPAPTQPLNTREAQENNPPPTPYVMPVYLPSKPVKPRKSHHERALPSNHQHSSGSDTEGLPRREHRHRTVDQPSGLRRNHAEGSSLTPENHRVHTSSKAAPGQSDRRSEILVNTQPSDRQAQESKHVSTQLPHSRSHEATAPRPPENRVEIPLITPALPQSYLPMESQHLGSGAPQFVSIRAGQGPSDPQTSHALYKDLPSSYPDVAQALATRPRPSENDRSQAHGNSSRPRAGPSPQSRYQAYNLGTDNPVPSASQRSLHPTETAGSSQQSMSHSSSIRPADAAGTSQQSSGPMLSVLEDSQGRSSGPLSGAQLQPTAIGVSQPPPSQFRDPHTIPSTSHTGLRQILSHSSKPDESQVPDSYVTSRGIISQSNGINLGAVSTSSIARPAKSARKVSFQLESDDASSADHVQINSAPAPAHAWSQPHSATAVPLPVVSKSSSNGTQVDELQSHSPRAVKNLEPPMTTVESSRQRSHEQRTASSSHHHIQQSSAVGPSPREKFHDRRPSVSATTLQPSEDVRGQRGDLVAAAGNELSDSLAAQQTFTSSPSHRDRLHDGRPSVSANTSQSTDAVHRQRGNSAVAGSTHSNHYTTNDSVPIHPSLAPSLQQSMFSPVVPVAASRASSFEAQPNSLFSPIPLEGAKLSSTPPRPRRYSKELTIPSSPAVPNSSPKHLKADNSSHNMHGHAPQPIDNGLKEQNHLSSAPTVHPSGDAPMSLVRRSSSQTIHLQVPPHNSSREPVASPSSMPTYPTSGRLSRLFPERSSSYNTLQQTSSQQQSNSTTKELTLSSSVPNSYPISNAPEQPTQVASSQNMYNGSSQPPAFSSKEPAVTSFTPVSASYPVSSVSTKPLAHRTSSSNMRANASYSSRLDEPRMTQPSSGYPASSYRTTTYPEAPISAQPHVANPRIEEPTRSESRSAIPVQYPSYNQPQPSKTVSYPTSTSQSYEPPKNSQPLPPPHTTPTPHASSIAPATATAPRSASKVHGSSSRYVQPVDSSSRSRPSVATSGVPSNPLPSTSTQHHRSTTTSTAYPTTYPQPLVGVGAQSTQNVAPLASYPQSSAYTSQAGSTRPQGYPTASSARPQMPTVSSGSQSHFPYQPQSASVSTRIPVTRSVSEDTVLMTPSSLAPSMLKSTTPRPSQPPSPKPSQESRKRGGRFLSMFRSKTSPPKNREVSNPTTTSKAADHLRSQSETNVSVNLASGSNVKIAAPKPSKARAPPPVTVPIPVSTSGRKSPTSKVFSPFRFMTSKRHRTVSAASLEAQDGTANNTVVGSPTQSTVSQAPGLQPPPLRDPLLAAQDWRNLQEAELMGRGTGRRRRPGVTFDVEEEHHPVYRFVGQGVSQPVGISQRAR